MYTKYLSSVILQLLQQSGTKLSRSGTIKMRSLEKPFIVDEATANSVLSRHEGILKLVVKRFKAMGAKYNISYDDLLQVGRIGLIRGYQPLNLKISTILAHAITWDLQDYVYSNFSVIRVPKSTLNKKMDELKERLATKVNKGAKRLPALPILLSTDNPLETEAMRVGLDPYESDQSFLRVALDNVINDLSPNEQLVVRGVFFDKKSFTQLAAEMGTTDAEVKHLKDKALKKLRKPSTKVKLKDFYE